MSAARQAVEEILSRLPEDATLEEIEYEIYVRRKVAAGDADIAAGRVLTMDEMKLRFAKWTSDPSGRG